MVTKLSTAKEDEHMRIVLKTVKFELFLAYGVAGAALVLAVFVIWLFASVK